MSKSDVQSTAGACSPALAPRAHLTRLHMRDHRLDHSLMQHVMPLRVSRPLRSTILHHITSPLAHHATTVRLGHHSASNDASLDNAQPTVTSDDGGRTLRSRKHENKSLPLPFLMDPTLQKAKQKHQERKPRMIDSPTEAALEFRKKLNRNEHGNTLVASVDISCADSAPQHTH